MPSILPMARSITTTLTFFTAKVYLQKGKFRKWHWLNSSKPGFFFCSETISLNWNPKIRFSQKNLGLKQTNRRLKSWIDNLLWCGIFGFCLLSFPQNERKIYKLKQLSCFSLYILCLIFNFWMMKVPNGFFWHNCEFYHSKIEK